MTSNVSEAARPAAPADDAELVPVFLTVAVRTSAGPGPGVRRVPPGEAGWLIRQKYASAGTEPPSGYNLEVPG